MASPTNNGTDTFVGDNSSGFNWAAFGVSMTIVGLCCLFIWNCCLTHLGRYTVRLRIAQARQNIFELIRTVFNRWLLPASVGAWQMVQNLFGWVSNQCRRLRPAQQVAGGGVAGPPVPPVVPPPGGAAGGAQGPGVPPQGQAPAGGVNPYRVPVWLQNRRFWHNQPAANFPVIAPQVQLQQQHQGLQQVVVHVPPQGQLPPPVGGQQQQQPPLVGQQQPVQPPVVAAQQPQQPPVVAQQAVVAQQQQPQQPLVVAQPQQQQQPPQMQQQQQQALPRGQGARGGRGGRGGPRRAPPPPPPGAAAVGAVGAGAVGAAAGAAAGAAVQVTDYHVLDRFSDALNFMEWDDSYDTLLYDDYPTFLDIPPSEYNQLFFEGSGDSTSSAEGV